MHSDEEQNSTAGLVADTDREMRCEDFVVRCSGFTELLFESPVDADAFLRVLRMMSMAILCFLASSAVTCVWYITAAHKTPHPAEHVVVLAEQISLDASCVVLVLFGYIAAYVAEHTDYWQMYTSCILWMYIDHVVAGAACSVTATILELALTPSRWKAQRVAVTLGESVLALHVQWSPALCTMHTTEWLVVAMIQCGVWTPCICRALAWCSAPQPHLSSTRSVALLSVWVLVVLVLSALTAWHARWFGVIATSPSTVSLVFIGGVLVFFTQAHWRGRDAGVVHGARPIVLVGAWLALLVVVGQPVHEAPPTECPRLHPFGPCLPDATIVLARGVGLALFILTDATSGLRAHIDDEEARAVRFELSNCSVSLFPLNRLCSSLAFSWPVYQTMLVVVSMAASMRQMRAASLVLAGLVLPLALVGWERIWTHVKPSVVVVVARSIFDAHERFVLYMPACASPLISGRRG